MADTLQTQILVRLCIVVNVSLRFLSCGEVWQVPRGVKEISLHCLCLRVNMAGLRMDIAGRCLYV